MRSRSFRLWPLLLLLALPVLVAAGTMTARATAGHSAIPAAPGGVAQTPVEALASRIASRIAGRAVRVQCDSAAVWQQRGRSGEQLGFVQTEATSNAQGARYTADATLAELAPSVCVSLQLFGHATVKPSECRRSARAAYEPCFLGHSSTRSASQPTVCWTSSGCFTVAATVSNSFWDGYQQSVKALLTVAHESVHLQQVRAGAAVPPNSLVEAQAECSGLQWLADVAITFGDIQVDANSLADFAFKVLYPQARRASTGYMVAHPYWSPECRPGGKLDVRRPGSTFWP